MLELFVHLQVLTLATTSRASTALDRSSARPRRDDPVGVRDAGQTTAEYALVLLAAAAIALLVVAWATKTNRIGKLFDFVLDQIMGKAA